MVQGRCLHLTIERFFTLYRLCVSTRMNTSRVPSYFALNASVATRYLNKRQVYRPASIYVIVGQGKKQDARWHIERVALVTRNDIFRWLWHRQDSVAARILTIDCDTVHIAVFRYSLLVPFCVERTTRGSFEHQTANSNHINVRTAVCGITLR